MLLLLALLASVLAEIGLCVRSGNKDFDTEPVRLVDGQLAIGDGPIFQANFVNSELIISPNIIAEDAQGAGVALTSDGQLVVATTPKSGFYERGGWLEYNAHPLFYLKNSTSGWLLTRSPEGAPIMLQVSKIEYPNHHTTASESAGNGISSQIGSELTSINTSLPLSSTEINSQSPLNTAISSISTLSFLTPPSFPSGPSSSLPTSNGSLTFSSQLTQYPSAQTSTVPSYVTSSIARDTTSISIEHEYPTVTTVESSTSSDQTLLDSYLPSSSETSELRVPPSATNSENINSGADASSLVFSSESALSPSGVSKTWTSTQVSGVTPTDNFYSIQTVPNEQTTTVYTTVWATVYAPRPSKARKQTIKTYTAIKEVTLPIPTVTKTILLKGYMN